MGTYDEAPDAVRRWLEAGADTIDLVLPLAVPEGQLREMLEAAAPAATGRLACAPGLAWQILRAMSQDYLLANQPSELERLQLQSRVWEPSGRQLLSKLEGGSGGRVLDVGCGALGWLRILSEWVGPSGKVVGTDIDETLLGAARSFLEAEGIANAEVRRR